MLYMSFPPPPPPPPLFFVFRQPLKYFPTWAICPYVCLASCDMNLMGVCKVILFHVLSHLSSNHRASDDFISAFLEA